MNALAEVMEKAFGAKDYSKLIPVKQVDSLGRNIVVWKLPEDAKQQSLFGEDTEGKDAPVGKRGYVDHVDQGQQRFMIDPLVKVMKGINPELGQRMKYKYDHYRFDRDTRELDVQHDETMAWYMRKIKNDPENRADWQAEYNQKTDALVKKINNRKAAMMKMKKGSPVKYYGQAATVKGFSRRGFPVLHTAQGEKTALWEELA